MIEDTIAAISTPPGEGAISIVRISGPEALSIADRIFQSETKPSNSPSHRVIYGHIRAQKSKSTIDEVLLVVLKAPNTYTAEDMVEINCHGGFLVTRSVLEEVLRCGARLAEPGEFSKRAFLNGRIDLTQAEAVLDVIRSRTPVSLHMSIEQLEGSLREEMEGLRQQLVEILTQLEAAVDFTESDVQAVEKERFLSSIEILSCRIEELIRTSQGGKLVRDGGRLAIVGKSNVGKSSLLNALLKEERAIVSPVPGTTRDSIEEWLNIDGIPLRIIDTAGMGGSSGGLEREGARRTEERIGQADLLLFMVDGSVPLDDRDDAIIRHLEGRRSLVVINKIDLAQVIDTDHLKKRMKGPFPRISALYGDGLEDLRKSIIHKMLDGHSLQSEGVVVTHVRQRDALKRAQDSLQRSIKTLKKNLSEEFVAVDIREALESIGEITGETTTEEILNRIFSQFCIGK